ncbi:chemotaxis protein CheA [Parasphingopyxis sp. CP4]|uniref:chemotaxis protein CheA n=1 Tax=Parasphingopyxis sp. CP4 TaxID=2724527 RepID=UPI0015A0ECC3|nr:chemotaxis protein CheA [Parasphingopyxis sp. CP4]QLC21618.1 chemotaxis protein CheA [Parasphingopyxis sp. CP4]
MDELLAEFIAETREMLGTISGEIVAWEADPTDTERLDAVFRFVHTVKGSCGFLDLPHIMRISHEAETVLSELRNGKREPTSQLVGAILAIIDRIGDMADALERGEETDTAIDDALIGALNGSSSSIEVNPIEAEAPQTEVSEVKNPARSIRVPLELLDRLMGGVSDLVLARNELSRQIRRAQGDDQIDTAFDRMSTCVAEMRDAITWARMQRIESLFAALPRLVRDLSEELGKSVTLEIDGTDVELDREMIEMLRDPLTHIVRNALDHGIEAPDERAAANKTDEGVLRIAARQSGNQIQISISDDGRGIDPEKLKERAIKTGTLAREDIRSMTDNQLLDLVFQPGLSTADTVSTISGRGVGMDIVRSNVERIGGTIEVESELGQGTSLSMLVPLTLTIIPALVFGIGEQRYAIPRSSIEEIVSLKKDRARLEELGGTMIARVRDARLPAVRLAEIFDIDSAVGEASQDQHLIIVRSSRRERFAIMVSAVFDHEELVVKPAAPGIMGTGVYAGTTLPDNGLPLLLLDIAGIASIAGLRLSQASLATEDESAAPEKIERPDALVFMDLDGRRRAVRMALVERIIDADVSSIDERAGLLRLVKDGETIPVVASAPLPESGMVRLLRLSDGTNAITYAIAPGAADVVPLPVTFEPAARPGRIAGVAAQGDEAVELIDAHYLFAEFAGGAPRQETKPRCVVVGGDDHWRHELLAPLIEMAGYEVSFDADETATLVIDASEADAVSSKQADNVVRLSSDPSPGAGRLYRYDRAAIADALQKARG